MSERVHDILKNWIIEEAKVKVNSKGKPYHKRAYSGDSEPIDIRRKRKVFTHHPDVVLVETNKSVYFIEIAFSEKWREIVGQLALAKAADADTILYILCGGEDGWKEKEIDNILSVVGDAISFNEWHTLILTEEEYADAEKAKKRLRKDLGEWI